MAVFKTYNTITRKKHMIECPTESAYLYIGKFLKQAQSAKISTNKSLEIEIAKVNESGVKTELLVIENKGTNLNLLRKLKTFLLKYQDAKADEKKEMSLSVN